MGRDGARNSRKSRPILGQELPFWRAVVTSVGRASLLLPPVNSLAGRPAGLSVCVSGPWGTARRPEAGARALESCLYRNGETEVQRRPATGFRAVRGAPGAAVSRLPALEGPANSRKEAGPHLVRRGAGADRRRRREPEPRSGPRPPRSRRNITVRLTSQRLFASGPGKFSPSVFQHAAVCQVKHQTAR